MRFQFLLLVALLLSSIPAYADFLTFRSSAEFVTATPGLPVETFESALVPPLLPPNLAVVIHCDGPLSSATASACFPAGGLLPGVVYSASPVIGLTVVGPGLGNRLANSSLIMGSIMGDATLNLVFTGVTAVGFELFPFPVVENAYEINFFSPSDVALGSFTISSLPGEFGYAYFGLLSTNDLIGRVSIHNQSTQFPWEFIDNMSFGIPTVPEPSSMLLLAAGLALVFRLRRA